MKEPELYTAGKRISSIAVRISYRIIQLFSEGLYSSPNKAIEELVSNSFDAGASKVHVIVPPDLLASEAAIVVIDDGIGMNEDGLKEHWLIGVSYKRDSTRPLPAIGDRLVMCLVGYIADRAAVWRHGRRA